MYSADLFRYADMGVAHVIDIVHILAYILSV